MMCDQIIGRVLVLMAFKIINNDEELFSNLAFRKFDYDLLLYISNV